MTKIMLSAYELVPNDFSSETIGPVVTKFHMYPPWVGGSTRCSNGPGHMTKMAVMPIYGKKRQKSVRFQS